MQNFKLNYTVTSADVKAVNKRIMLFYFTLYFAVALIGIAVGIVAVVLRPQTFMLALGVILLVFGGLLLACSVMLLIAPKRFVTSVVPTDKALTVTVGERGVTVECDGEAPEEIPYMRISKVKLKNGVICVNVGRDGLLIVKDALCEGESFAALFDRLQTMQGRMTELPPELDPKADQSDAQTSEDPEQSE